MLTSLVSRLRDQIAPLADKIMEEALKAAGFVSGFHGDVLGGYEMLCKPEIGTPVSFLFRRRSRFLRPIVRGRGGSFALGKLVGFP